MAAFDVSSLAGLTVVGTPRIEFFLTGGSNGTQGIPRQVSLHEVLVPWDESDVTLNSFGPAAGVQFGIDVSSLAKATESVSWAGGTPQWVSWSVPASLVQSWIDNHEENFGILINNQLTTVHRDLDFASREASNFPAPKLVVEAVPPSAEGASATPPTSEP